MYNTFSSCFRSIVTSQFSTQRTFFQPINTPCPSISAFSTHENVTAASFFLASGSSLVFFRVVHVPIIIRMFIYVIPNSINSKTVQKSKIANALSKCSCKVVIRRENKFEAVSNCLGLFESYDLKEDNKRGMNQSNLF